MNYFKGSIKADSRVSLFLNQGYSARLKEVVGVPYPLGTEEYEAFVFGFNQCDDYERSQGREMRR